MSSEINLASVRPASLPALRSRPASLWHALRSLLRPAPMVIHARSARVRATSLEFIPDARRPFSPRDHVVLDRVRPRCSVTVGAIRRPGTCCSNRLALHAHLQRLVSARFLTACDEMLRCRRGVAEQQTRLFRDLVGDRRKRSRVTLFRAPGRGQNGASMRGALEKETLRRRHDRVVDRLARAMYSNTRLQAERELRCIELIGCRIFLTSPDFTRLFAGVIVLNSQRR